MVEDSLPLALFPPCIKTCKNATSIAVFIFDHLKLWQSQKTRPKITKKSAIDSFHPP
jgi:hypothetical protein